MLDGPSCLDRPDDADRASQFFSDLDKWVTRGDLDDPAELEQAFFEPYAQQNPNGEGGIEIMTIHRAKGLEFDTVIVLGLAKRVRGPDPQALHWHERWNDQGTARLLLAPLSSDKNRLTSYLQRIEQQRDLAERSRLLYVATTRARDRLHLIAQLGDAQQGPPRGTMLELLWPNVAEDFAATDGCSPTPPRPRAPLRPLLTRLAGGFNETQPRDLGDAPPTSSANSMRPEFAWAGQTAVQVGTLVHRELQIIAEMDPNNRDSGAIEARLRIYRRDLAMLGVVEHELESSAQRVCLALLRVIADPRGQWILAPHSEAASEIRLTIGNEDRLEHVRIDRTFVDQSGTRWIIDYKTSAHEGGNVAAFLDSEVARYKPQLERYAAAMGAIDSRPIRVGLYFPLLAQFRGWEPDTES
jgi:ATP-dependent exoDNAse (exonuclease V) beta subunit